MKVNQSLLSPPKQPATAAPQAAAAAATTTTTTTAAAATTIAGTNNVVSASDSGSGSCTDTALAEHKRYHTGGQLQQQQQQQHQQRNNNNNSNGPGNNWRQMKSTKYNARPWLSGRRSYSFKNNWNNCNPNFNYMQNNSRDSCQNQSNNSNRQFSHSHRNNSESFGERSSRRNTSPYSNQRWSSRDHQERSNYNRCSSRFGSSRDEVRRESSRRGGGEEHRDKETSEQQEKPKQQTENKAYKAREEDQTKSKKEITNPQESKEEREKKTKTKEDGLNRPTTSRGLRSTTTSCSPLKSLEGEKRKPPAKPSEVQKKPTKSSSEKEPQAVSLQTYPQIQVRPLTELLKQEILAVTQEKREAGGAPSPNGGIVQLTSRSATHLRRPTVSSHGEASITDRLASMDKEGLKYIINNSDTIYNEHLKQQARRRLREEIRRQLKDIELDQPKDQPAKELVEDEIVDAIKLPQILLQEIEKCFGLELSVQEQQGEQEEQQELEQEQVGQVQEQQLEQQPVGQEQQEQEQQQEVHQVVQEQQQLEQEQLELEQEQEQLEQKPDINNIIKEENDQPIAHMAKESSTDLMRRLEVAEQSSKAGNITAATPTTQKQSVESRKRNLEKQQQEQIAVKAQTNLLAIKKEVQKDSNSNSPITYIVLSSSEDEDDDEKDEELEMEAQRKLQKELEQEKEEQSDHSNSSRLKEDAEKVVDSFEKLLLPQLKESLAERYRSSHCTSLQSRLLFISCVVTSERNTQQTFSKIEVAKIQQNLKSSDNRLGIEFLQREIANVVNQFKQREQEKELERETVAAANEPNELNLACAIDDKSAELAASHQRETDAASSSSRASLLPTPPRNGTPTTNMTNATRSLHPALALGVPYLSLDAATAAVGLPKLNGLGSLESVGESLLLSSGDSVVQSLLEIDRRLLENQNRRSFLEEMIMKFQKEKSDMEMASLELQNRKFLLLNAVIGRKQMAAAASTSSPLLANTPTNSPPPPPPPAAPSPPAVAPPKRKLRPKRRTRFLPKRKPKKLHNPPAQQVNEAESKSCQTEESLTSSTATSTSKSISIPQSIKQEPAAPVELAEPVQLNKENEATTKRAASDSNGAASNKRQCLGRSASTNASQQQQQPLAVIPPLPPPPPPPEPFSHMSYELPRMLRKPTPPPAQAPSSPQSVGSESFNYGFIPSGRLHNIVSPITQICIHKVSIIAASENGDIYVFNIGSHKLEQQIPKHSEAITNMFLCDRESFLYTTSLDGFLKKSSLENLERIVQTVYLKEPLQSIDIAWGIAFIGSRWGNIFTYNIAANKVMETPLLSTGQSIIAVKATKEGARKIIMLGCKGNNVFLHDAATGLLLRRLSVPEGLNVYSLLLVDGFVFCGTQKNEVYKFDFASGALTNTLSCGNGAVAMASYRDRYLLIGCYDGFIYVLNKENGLRLGRFSGPGRLVLSLAIAGDKIVTSSKDNSLEVLEIPPEILCMDNET